MLPMLWKGRVAIIEDSGYDFVQSKWSDHCAPGSVCKDYSIVVSSAAGNIQLKPQYRQKKVELMNTCSFLGHSF